MWRELGLVFQWFLNLCMYSVIINRWSQVSTKQSCNIRQQYCNAVWIITNNMACINFYDMNVSENAVSLSYFSPEHAREGTETCMGLLLFVFGVGWGGWFRLYSLQAQVAHSQTAGAWVLLLVWSWWLPVGWHNTLQDTVGTHLPWQGLLTDAPMHPPYAMPPHDHNPPCPGRACFPHYHISVTVLT